jgi:hypothetical protein
MLRLSGAFVLLAFGAVVLPTETMVSTHASLGMGELPRLPIIQYLTRSVAALYGFHGALVLLVSTDPVRYLPIVRFIGVMNVGFGAIMTGIDLHAGMPLWWTLAEGPPIAVVGVVILGLASRVR